MDCTNVLTRDAINRGNLPLQHLSLERPYIGNLHRRQLARWVESPVLIRTVKLPILLVLSHSLPRQMSRVAASQMSFAATMRGLMMWCGSRTMGNGTGANVNFMPLPTVRHGAVSSSPSVRPRDAIIRLSFHDHLIKVSSGFAVGKFDVLSRVAMPAPFIVMVGTVTSAVASRLRASINRTFGHMLSPVSIRVALSDCHVNGGAS